MVSPARIGVVLAGGRATRMGGDKAGAVLAGQTLLERAVATVSEAGLQVRVCARADTALPHIAGLEAGAIWREPVGLGPHPLAGIAHALKQASEPIVVLPVDLPLLPAVVLAALARQTAPLAVLGVDGHPASLVVRIDPLHSAALTDAASLGAPALRTLAALGATVVNLAELAPHVEPRRALANVNSPGDLSALDRLL